MEIKYLIVKEKVKMVDVTVEHICTDDIVADPLTKGIRPYVFERHVASMGLCASWDAFV